MCASLSGERLEGGIDHRRLFFVRRVFRRTAGPSRMRLLNGEDGPTVAALRVDWRNDEPTSLDRNMRGDHRRGDSRHTGANAHANSDASAERAVELRHQDRGNRLPDGGAGDSQ
jgi:hypothetical protein